MRNLSIVFTKTSFIIYIVGILFYDNIVFRLAYDPRRQLRVRDITRAGDNQNINKHAVRAQDRDVRVIFQSRLIFMTQLSWVSACMETSNCTWTLSYIKTAQATVTTPGPGVLFT